MKSWSLLASPVVRVVAILSLLGAIAAPVAHAQVSFLQPLTFQGSTPRWTLILIGTASSTLPRPALYCWATATALSKRRST